ncbi:MAG: WxL domain-containing protein [Candidatus Dormibacteria bacterium]
MHKHVPIRMACLSGLITAATALAVVIVPMSVSASTTASVSLTETSTGTGSGSGYLNMSVPSTLSFGTVALTGLAQSVNGQFIACTGSTGSACTTDVDVNDLTGSGAGWNVSLNATQFENTSGTPSTCTTTTPCPLTGSALSQSTPPTWYCDSTGCNLATNPGIAAPLSFTYGTAAPFLSANSSTTSSTTDGVGDQNAASVFTLTIPASALAGSYSSTWTVAIASGP